MTAKLSIFLIKSAQLLEPNPHRHQGALPWTPLGDMRPPDLLVRPPMLTENRRLCKSFIIMKRQLRSVATTPHDVHVHLHSATSVYNSIGLTISFQH